MKKIIFLLFFITLLFGCFPNSFIPQTQNTPLFTDKEQLELNFVHTHRSFEHQIAYSPVKNFAAMSNFSLATTSTVSEFGIGGYKQIGKALVVEMFGGYAYCENHFSDTMRIENSFFEYYPHAYSSQIYANRYFLQPVIGFRFTDRINLSLSAKFCYWDYERYEYYGETVNFGQTPLVTYNDSIVKPHTTNSTIEPTITLKVGGKYGKFMFQSGMYYVINENPRFQTPYRHFPYFIRIGYNMTIDFNSFKNNKSLN
ncbi:MAG: hypothetical protein JNL24_06690 [Bacteroidia bacterium]|nr:hypothetical protein [Bacteroidia bacterium]